jgi:hypothetical protein
MSDNAGTTHPLEVALADTQPFGDCDYIWQRVCLHYRRRVEMLGEYSEYGSGLLAALDDSPVKQHRRVLGDPIVRVTVDNSLSRVKMGGEPFPDDTLEAVLRIATANLREGATVPLLAEGSEDYFRIYEAPWPWVWSEVRGDDDPLGEFFRRHFSRELPELVLATPDSPTREMLLAGMRLLRVLCPRLTRSAMSHVQLIGMVGAPLSPGFASLTSPRFPGTFFLAESVLTNPWQAAEHLLHEAMHVKFVDLEHTHSLVSADYDDRSSPMIRPPWHRAQPGAVTEWPLKRSLTALHVYTCLALFFTNVTNRSADLEAEYGPLQVIPTKQTRRSFDRANYLRQQLEHYEEYLGFAGALFVRWLGKMLRSIDPSPPPEGSYVHLVP